MPETTKHMTSHPMELTSPIGSSERWVLLRHPIGGLELPSTSAWSSTSTSLSLTHVLSRIPFVSQDEAILQHAAWSRQQQQQVRSPVSYSSVTFVMVDALGHQSPNGVEFGPTLCLPFLCSACAFVPHFVLLRLVCTLFLRNLPIK